MIAVKLKTGKIITFRMPSDAAEERFVFRWKKKPPPKTVVDLKKLGQYRAYEIEYIDFVGENKCYTQEKEEEKKEDEGFEKFYDKANDILEQGKKRRMKAFYKGVKQGLKDKKGK